MPSAPGLFTISHPEPLRQRRYTCPPGPPGRFESSGDGNLQATVGLAVAVAAALILAYRKRLESWLLRRVGAER